MIVNFLIDVILLLPKAIFALLGALPFVNVTFNEYVAKFIGWGCYICGTPLMSALFISIFGWCTVFTVLGIFKFIKNNVPLA